jgi:small subunit ribosomal protein S4
MIKPPEFRKVLKNKKRHRVLCKKLIDLKKNAQDKVKLMHFKKKKWKKFVEFLQKSFNSKKQGFRFYDQGSDNIFKFQTRFRQGCKKRLQAQKRFNYYYGCFLKRYLKIQVKIAKKRKGSYNTKLWTLSKVFISFFERRVDTIIHRSHFVSTMRQARQLISHKHVKINGKIVNINSYQVQEGDLISLIPQKKLMTSFNGIKTLVWPIPEKHLQINYRTFQIIFIKGLETNSFGTQFPFHLELESVLNYYK